MRAASASIPATAPTIGRATADNLRFIVDHFGPKLQRLPADIILCRHTLEHIAAGAHIRGAIREAIGPREDTWVVFETPDAQRVLREGAFWDIYYEHCSYFSPGTHARLFREQGFDVTELSLVYERAVHRAVRAACAPRDPAEIAGRA